MIGDKLRELRGTKTQAQVAKDLGISISAYSMYENDSRVPRDELKVKIAQYYGSTVTDIFFANLCHKS